MAPNEDKQQPLTLEEIYDIRQVCQDFLSKKNNLPFAELCNLAERVGFLLKKQDGTSHIQGKHPDYACGPPYYDKITLQKKKGNRAVPYQVEQVVKFIRNAVPKMRLQP